MLNVHHRFALIAVVLALALTAFVFYRFGTQSNQPSKPTTTTSASQTDEKIISNKTKLFATMLAFNSNEGLGGDRNMQELLMTGWSTLIADASTYKKFLTTLASSFKETARLASLTNFSSNRDVVGAFVWNVIEPTKGTYDWSLSDRTVAAAGNAGMTLSAVIQPFASWDQTVDPAAYKKKCQAIDFGFYDFKGGPPNDLDAYTAFVKATVERYDGDGIDDMPGLTTRVEDWEIGNEVEGQCGGYEGQPQAYVDLLKASYAAVKAADPAALVLNAGALEIAGHGSGPAEAKQFWQDFFAAGGDQYLDVFNLHYNKERMGADTSPDVWISHLDFFNELMASSQGRKPMWVTEFGTYSGTPKQLPPPGRPESEAHSLATQSEAFQSAWYFRYAVMGFSEGVKRIFIDLEGSNNSGITASSLFDQGGRGKDGVPRAFLATLQTMATALDGFDAVEKLGEGQYIFDMNGHKVYALWNGSLPSTLFLKTLTIIGLDGTRQSMNASDVTFDENAPVLVLE